MTRRRLVQGIGGFGLAGAGLALLAGCRDGSGPSESVGAEAPPETTTLRIGQTPSICQSPLYVAQELLHGEGFTDVQYVQYGGELGVKAVATGQVDIAMNFAGPLLISLEAGEPIVMLAGGHVGCFELFGTERVRTIRDLKGKHVAVTELGGPQHVFLASMAAYVGLDPRKDIDWAILPLDESVRQLTEGNVDALLAFPPAPQELRAKQIGHVVTSSAVDRPWSQYFCCLVYAHPDFVRRHPVTIKRALRAMLKAADMCALDPQGAARALTERGFTTNPAYALQAMQDIPYGKWREYDPEDTLRFYALRLKEAGMLKSSPQKLISQGTDWRILKELKKELKG